MNQYYVLTLTLMMTSVTLRVPGCIKMVPNASEIKRSVQNHAKDIQSARTVHDQKEAVGRYVTWEIQTFRETLSEDVGSRLISVVRIKEKISGKVLKDYSSLGHDPLVVQIDVGWNSGAGYKKVHAFSFEPMDRSVVELLFLR